MDAIARTRVVFSYQDSHLNLVTSDSGRWGPVRVRTCAHAQAPVSLRLSHGLLLARRTRAGTDVVNTWKLGNAATNNGLLIMLVRAIAVMRSQRLVPPRACLAPRGCDRNRLYLVAIKSACTHFSSVM